MSFTPPPSPPTTPPPAPSRASPSTFAALADAFVAWLETFGPWLTTFIAWITTHISELNTFDTTQSGYATAASGSATAAAGSATAAAGSATAAAASATSAVNAPGTSGTSTTSLTIGTGDTPTITTQSGKSWVVGQPVQIARTSAPTTTFMAGQIKSYSGTSLVVTITTTQGSGTATDWTISLTAPTVTAQAITTSNLTQATGHLLGRTTAGTGTPEEISVGATLTLSPGSLSVANAACVIAISTASASSSSTIDVTLANYDEYWFVFRNVVPNTDGAIPWVRVSQAATFKTGATDYGYTSNKTTGSTNTPAGGTDSKFVLGSGVENTVAQGGMSGVFRIYQPSNTARRKHVEWKIVYYLTTGAMEMSNGCGIYDTGAAGSNAAIDQLRFMFSTSNVAQGDFTLYAFRVA